MRQMLAIAWRYLWARPLAAALNLLLLTLGLGSISFLLLVSSQIDQAFERGDQPVDFQIRGEVTQLLGVSAAVFQIRLDHV